MAAIFNAEKISKSRCPLKNDPYANIYFMKGYLYKEKLKYLHELDAYRNISKDNKKWTQNTNLHKVLNIGIDNDHYINNDLVFITKIDNK